MPLPRAELHRAVAHLQRGDWQAAHEIVHLMEGDQANARYWYRAAKRPFPDGADIAAEIRAAREELRP